MSQTTDDPLPPIHTSRLAALISGGSLVMGLIVIGFLTGNFFVDVVQGIVIDGAILLAYLGAAFGWGYRLVGATPASSANSSTTGETGDAGVAPTGFQWVTSIAVGLGVMGLLTLGLGLAGAFNRYAAIGLILIGLILAAVFLRKQSFRSKSFDRNSLWWMLPFAIVLGLALVCASMPPMFLWKPLDPHPYDVMSYHLQVPREWFDAGRIIPLKHNAFSYFPMAMEMHSLAAMHLRGGPWAGMYLCQFMSLAHGALTVVAIAQTARTLGATPMRAWSAAFMVACVPWVFQLSTVAYVEPGLMLYATLAVGWGLVAIRSQSLRALVLVGVLAGLACGMKYTAIVMVAAPVCGLTALLAMSRTNWLKALVVPGLVCAVVASPWLVRNIAWTGNPVFPLATGVFGRAHFEEDQVERYRIAHRPIDTETSLSTRLYNGWMRTVRDPQHGFLVVPLGLAAILVLGIRASGTGRRSALFLGALIGAMVAVWIGATHVVPRFISPMIPLLGLAIALMPIPSAATLVACVTQGMLGLVLLLGWADRGFATWEAPKDPRDPYPFEIGRSGAFRLSDFSVLETPEMQAARMSSAPVALIGDAQAFYWQIPSGRLIYRSVFDVHVSPGASLVDGWVGEPIDSLRRRGVWVVINTNELDRLSRTYRGLPKPQSPWDQIAPGPIVLPPIR